MSTPEPTASLDPEDECPCQTTELRTRTYRNGQKVYVRQCLVCGDGLSLPVKTASLSVRERLAAPPVDEGLRQRWYEERWQRRRAAAQAERLAEADARRIQYCAYLLTDAWRSKSRATLERDGHRCQARLDGCDGRAVQAHHLNYDRIFDEPLFDLVAVCRACHARLHGKEEPEW